MIGLWTPIDRDTWNYWVNCLKVSRDITLFHNWSNTLFPIFSMERKKNGKRRMEIKTKKERKSKLHFVIPSRRLKLHFFPNPSTLEKKKKGGEVTIPLPFIKKTHEHHFFFTFIYSHFLPSLNWTREQSVKIFVCNRLNVHYFLFWDLSVIGI